MWDGSWKYTPKSDPCMRIWFDGDKENPNYKTALYYNEQIVKDGGHSLEINILQLLVMLGLLMFV